jgi:uncharacterized repeat protein (TIGR02543 family)
MLLTIIREIIEKVILPIILKPLHGVIRKKRPIFIFVLSAVIVILIVVSVILRTPQIQSQTPPQAPPKMAEHGAASGGAVTPPEEPPPPDRFYRVVYLKNGAEGTEPLPGEARAGSDITIKSGDTLSKWRSVFTGWKSDTGTHYNAGDTVNNISENITLTAQWKPVQFRDETKQIMTGRTHSFFSGEVQLHFARTGTKDVSPGGAIPVYTYVVYGWMSAGGKRESLTEFEEGNTYVFSEAFDITVTHIQRHDAEFTVRKYTP